MPCRPFYDKDGRAIGIACGGPRPKPCSEPGCSSRGTKLCDFPIHAQGRKSRTCDAPICDKHATKAGDDLDWCPPHARYVRDQEDGDR